MKTRTWVMILLLVVLPLGYAGECDGDHDSSPTVARSQEDTTVTPIPAPGAIVLVAVGALSVGYLRRKDWMK